MCRLRRGSSYGRLHRCHGWLLRGWKRRLLEVEGQLAQRLVYAGVRPGLRRQGSSQRKGEEPGTASTRKGKLSFGGIQSNKFRSFLVCTALLARGAQ